MINTLLPLPHDKKLTVVIRIEPGCLGPDGNNHVRKFCSSVETEIKQFNSDFVNWEVVPRFDKSLPEIEYKVANKILTHDQAEQYLALFNQKIDQVEEHVNEELAILIDQHLSH